jgi:tellurite resistance protein TehA-like permease
MQMPGRRMLLVAGILWLLLGAILMFRFVVYIEYAFEDELWLSILFLSYAVFHIVGGIIGIARRNSYNKVTPLIIIGAFGAALQLSVFLVPTIVEGYEILDLIVLFQLLLFLAIHALYILGACRNKWYW